MMIVRSLGIWGVLFAGQVTVLGSPPAFDAALQEIRGRYEHARPLWALEGLQNLAPVWAAQADNEDEKKRLAAISFGSPEYWTQMRLRYGLHPLPANERTPANAQMPLGLNQTKARVLPASGLFGEWKAGVQVNCRFCHSSVLFTSSDSKHAKPQLAEGMPNPFLDFERLHQDVAAAGDTPVGHLFRRNPPRGFINSADFFGVLIPYLRPEYPKVSLLRYNAVFTGRPGNAYVRPLEPLVALIPYLKTQPWTSFKHKLAGTALNAVPDQPQPIGGNGLYVDGGFFGNTADVTYAMAMSIEVDGSDYIDAKNQFAAVVPSYFKTLRAPSYPFPIDQKKAAQGFEVFSKHCAECHGDFALSGEGRYEQTSYPGKIIPWEEVQTDRLRLLYGYQFSEEQRKKFLDGTVVRTYGYKAPPLEGIWARSPYLHNASVPNLVQLLDSSRRMKSFGIYPDSTDPANFDTIQVGWKAIDLSSLSRREMVARVKAEPYLRIYYPDYQSASEMEKLKTSLRRLNNPVVDPEKPQEWTGMANTGHTFGDVLSAPERESLIEFLKAL